MATEWLIAAALPAAALAVHPSSSMLLLMLLLLLLLPSLMPPRSPQLPIRCVEPSANMRRSILCCVLLQFSALLTHHCLCHPAHHPGSARAVASIITSFTNKTKKS